MRLYRIHGVVWDRPSRMQAQRLPSYPKNEPVNTPVHTPNHMSTHTLYKVALIKRWQTSQCAS